VPPMSFTHKPIHPQTLIHKQFGGTPALIHIGWTAGELIALEWAGPAIPATNPQKEKTTCQ